MKAAFFYNYRLTGDVLLVDINNQLIPNRHESKGDVTLVYSNDVLVGINIFNISKVIKLKTEGRIVLPPDTLIDFINNNTNKDKK